MAAATADRDAQRSDGELKSVPMLTAVKIYKDTLVNIVSASGFVRAAAANAAELFCGVAIEQKDNTGGASGAKTIRVRKTGEYLFAVSGGTTQADLGKEVYVTDDSTVQVAAPANPIKVGKIVEYISNTQVRVRINGYSS